MSWTIRQGDALERLREMPNASVHCCVTSPPYWGLRDYGVEGQLGLEASPDVYIAKMVEVFAEVRRVLRDDGTLWLNLGDSDAGGASGRGDCGNSIGIDHPASSKHDGTRIYRAPAGRLKPKDLVGAPWAVAFALRAEGWYLRQDIIWSKPNPMPESTRDRCTKAHEYLFLLSKSARYHYDIEAIKEDCVAGDSSFTSESDRATKPNLGMGKRKVIKPRGWATGADHSAVGWATEQKQGKSAVEHVEIDTRRNKRSVWEISTSPFPEAHFATFPPKLVEPCILAGCPESGIVLDPFAGAGTTGLVATRLQRSFVGIELNPEYIAMAERRITSDAPLFHAEPATIHAAPAQILTRPLFDVADDEVLA